MNNRPLTNFTLLLSVLILSAISSEMLLIERADMAQADSVIATITVGRGPYGDLFDPANGLVYTANGDHFGFPTKAPLVKSMHLSEPTNSVLISLLEAASQFVSHSSTNNAGACGELVTFTAQVQSALQLNKITPAQSFQLLRSAHNNILVDASGVG
jgi:DNA-binding beta-propeller fold protein YncE